MMIETMDPIPPPPTPDTTLPATTARSDWPIPLRLLSFAEDVTENRSKHIPYGTAVGVSMTSIIREYSTHHPRTKKAYATIIMCVRPKISLNLPYCVNPLVQPQYIDVRVSSYDWLGRSHGKNITRHEPAGIFEVIKLRGDSSVGCKNERPLCVGHKYAYIRENISRQPRFIRLS
jgi:hypothetical protein